MNIKVVRRSQVIFHGVFLVLFSIALHYLVSIIISKDSILSLQMFVNYMTQNKLIISIGVLAAITTFMGKRIGFFLLSLLCLSIIGLLIKDYYVTLNKGILIAGFIYLVCSYFIVLSLFFELRSPPFSPGYEPNQVDNRKIPDILVSGVDDSGREYKGNLVKISVDSFYVIDRFGEKIRGCLTARIPFEGMTFECQAYEVTRGDGGRGFRIDTSQSDLPLSWYNFYRMLKDRGYYLE